jgi:hypothetical protein
VSPWLQPAPRTANKIITPANQYAFAEFRRKFIVAPSEI